MKLKEYLEEGVGSSRPRSGGGKSGNEAAARLKYHADLMKKEKKSSQDAFKIVTSTSKQDLKKMGYM